MWIIDPRIGTVHGQKSEWSSAIDIIMAEAANVQWAGNKCDLPDWDRSLLEEVWNALIEPLSKWLPEKNSDIVIIFDQKIATIPWGALKGKDGLCLSQKYRPSLLPSILCLTSTNEISSSRYLVVAPDLYLGRQPGNLPDAAYEGKLVATLYCDVDPIDGPEAAIEVLSSPKPPLQLMHVASHCSENENEGHMCLQFHTTNNKRLLLSQQEIENTKLEAKLVILSGCGTAISGSKDNNILGLAQSFYKAGAQVVVGTLWPVHDATTRRLIAFLYRNLNAGKTVSESIQLTVDHFRAVAQDKNPVFWAPFAILGKGNTVIKFPQKEKTVCLPACNYFTGAEEGYDGPATSEKLLDHLGKLQKDQNTDRVKVLDS